jgi:hypothetical protein
VAPDRDSSERRIASSDLACWESWSDKISLYRGGLGGSLFPASWFLNKLLLPYPLDATTGAAKGEY